MANDRWLTFDCFGTLIDWKSGFSAILSPFAGDRIDSLVDAYHKIEFVLELENPNRRYHEVLTTGITRAAKAIELPMLEPDSLARRWGELPLFPDVPHGLAAMREAGWKIAMLTNCDDDMFAQTLSNNPQINPDLVVTAQMVSCYKPSLGHFARFERETGVDRQNWVHVANSWFHDIEPARRYGVSRRVWINRDRTGEDPAMATVELPDIASLPSVEL